MTVKQNDCVKNRKDVCLKPVPSCVAWWFLSNLKALEYGESRDKERQNREGNLEETHFRCFAARIACSKQSDCGKCQD